MARAAKTWGAKTKTRYDDRRVKTAERGYDGRWVKFRTWFLAEHPLCQDCLREGKATASNEVHHLVKIASDRSRRLDEGNCMALCHACHSKRTAMGE